ncbi:S9 family peptidase [Niabella drilacis]|uniref:Dipeptidyl aminopeptidase/acylaminoacyl peptidase n=1 Tax=Niabella drilacis (strain DSM 25811 / CCM 8410 / CCUG 62505 / LMG 26954 / E90) TaxID=1285928 RepID=A0A1G6MXQ0_NIADE|nr:prolyl oligopeptidase family serine peptidase [Niabella drilacis]SDC60329.1 Dipeptidyl aminopeptidase/acylaminoacyl peptidase [Niabella drilacis]
MKKLILLAFTGGLCSGIHAQKKPLNHTVYDQWQSIGKSVISNNGKWIVYNIQVQEGDDALVIQATDQSYKKVVPRGYDARITGDNRTVVFRIKPLFAELRQAKIKKKKPADMPRDSFAVVNLGDDKIMKLPGLISYKGPKDQNEWVAGLLKNEPAKKPVYQSDKSKDSLQQVVDSLQYVINTLKPREGEGKDSVTDYGMNNRLLLVNTISGAQRYFFNISDYAFNKKGSQLLMVQTLDLKDTSRTARVLLYQLKTGKTDTLLRGGNDFKSLVLSDEGDRLAFLAERDARPKALQRFYKLWYYRQGMDSAIVLVDTLTQHMPGGSTVSEFGKLSFSKSGRRLLFATAPVKPPKDTTLVDIDKVNLDIWNYKDDYLQPYQLENQKRDQQRSDLAVYDFDANRMIQVGRRELPNVYEAPESDGICFIAVTDTGRRVESQWMGRTRKDVYKMDIRNGRYVPVVQNLEGPIAASWCAPSGKYVLWYDSRQKNYFVFDGTTARNITAAINVPLYDEENDVPDEPAPYGIMGWTEGDRSVLIYDRYDIWMVDPRGKALPVNLTKNGRLQQVTYRYIATDPEARYIRSADKNLLHVFNNENKKAGFAVLENNRLDFSFFTPALFREQPSYFDSVAKAKDAAVYAYTKECYTQSPDLYVFANGKETKLSATNPQQLQYNWGTAGLYHWTTFSGKSATGTLYLPEDFDSTKKYPVLLYFYEKLSDNLFRYIAPAPTPSRLNISFFVSRGYVVLAPDISYTVGHPANSAYDYIVSGAKDLTRHSWVDAAHMGIQGQSWGGIQVAQLITMTPMFAAAWAGAPVANMTSAYGGIRWKGGVNRQFQYEKTQSRIGSTLWEKPELYIENSPLFHLPKVTTPLVIMANDNDGAVPWYQGIELFTGMRRLGKQVWMLNYNGEEHNLVQRKNRKDISIREQQFFDWLLKGAKPARWLTEGVPAVNKGVNWGLEQ